MSEINAPATLYVPSGTNNVVFNVDDGSDTYWLTNVTGLDGAPRRTTREPKPRTDGGIRKPAPKDGRLITIEGIVIASTVADRNDMCDYLIAGVDELFGDTHGSWLWSPTGQPTVGVYVYGEMPVAFTGGYVKSFIFALYAPDPTIWVD